MANDYHKEVADFLRTQNNMPLDASDEELIQFAQETNPQEFEKITAAAYGNEPEGPSIRDTYPEEQAKNQYKVENTITKVGELAQESTKYNPLTYVGKAFKAAGDTLQPAFDKVTDTPLKKVISTVASPTGLGALNILSEAGKVINKAGEGLVKNAEKLAEEGKVARAAAIGAVGGAMEMVPSRQADIVLGFVPLEQWASAGAKLGKETVVKTGNFAEKAAAYFPGASLMRDANLAGKSQARVNLADKMRTESLGRELTYQMDKVNQAESSLAPIKDNIIYGEFAKKGLDFQEQLSKAPLKERAKALASAPEMSKISSVSDIGAEASKIADELTGVVSNTKDAAVESIVNKYLGKAQKETPVFIFDERINKAGEKVYGFTKSKSAPPPEYAEAAVNDLLKDRSRVGEAYMRARKLGVLNTEQSTALLKLQSVIDDGIARRLADNEGALAELAEIRAGWKNHYDKFASDTAVAVKQAGPAEVLSKITENADSVEQARAIMPTAVFEKMSSDAALELSQGMSKASNATKFLEEKLAEGKGYYERLLGENQVKSLQILADRKVDVAGMIKQQAELGEKIKNYVPMSQRKLDTFLSKLRRNTDTKSAMLNLGGIVGTEIAAGVAMMTHHPAVAGTLMAMGLAPAAFMYAYYAGGRTMRASLEKGLIGAMKMGKATPASTRLLLLNAAEAGRKGLEIKHKNPDAEVKPSLPKVKVPKSMDSVKRVKDILTPEQVNDNLQNQEQATDAYIGGDLNAIFSKDEQDVDRNLRKKGYEKSESRRLKD